VIDDLSIDWIIGSFDIGSPVNHRTIDFNIAFAAWINWIDGHDPMHRSMTQ